MFCTIQSRVSKFCIKFGNSVWNLVILFSGKSLNLLQLDVSFKAKMHQIQFRLGLRPRSNWRNLRHSPDLPAGFQGSTCKGGKGMSEKWDGGRGRREGRER